MICVLFLPFLVHDVEFEQLEAIALVLIVLDERGSILLELLGREVSLELQLHNARVVVCHLERHVIVGGR